MPLEDLGDNFTISGIADHDGGIEPLVAVAEKQNPRMPEGKYEAATANKVGDGFVSDGVNPGKKE
jgi:hypothetical protein